MNIYTYEMSRPDRIFRNSRVLKCIEELFYAVKNHRSTDLTLYDCEMFGRDAPYANLSL